MKTTIDILRRKSPKEPPYLQTYTYDLHPGMSVLNVLEIIKQEDATLRFAHCCDGACCGICAVECNGRPGLACRIPAEPEMRLAPLKGIPVLVDLIPDRDDYDSRRSALKLYPSGTGSLDAPIRPFPAQAEARVKVAARCIECLSCLSVCPVFRKQASGFAGPCHFALIARHVFDPRDSTDRRAILQSMQPQLCIQCGLCSKVCPADAQPAEAIRLLCHQGERYGAVSEDDTGT